MFYFELTWLDGITDAMDTNLGKLWEMVRDGGPGVLQSMGSQRVRHDWATEQHRWRTVLYELQVCSVVIQHLCVIH